MRGACSSVRLGCRRPRRFLAAACPDCFPPGTRPVTWTPAGTSTSPSGTCLRTSPPSAPISSLPATSSATTTCCGCPLRHALTWVGRRPTTTASSWSLKTKPPWRSTVPAVTLQVSGQGPRGPRPLVSAISHHPLALTPPGSGPSTLGRGHRGLLRGGVSTARLCSQPIGACGPPWQWSLF